MQKGAAVWDEPPVKACFEASLASEGSKLSELSAMSKGAHCEGEAGAGSLDGEDGRADISVILEVIHQVRSRARLHAAVDAHVSLLRPVQRITAGERHSEG